MGLENYQLGVLQKAESSCRVGPPAMNDRAVALTAAKGAGNLGERLRHIQLNQRLCQPPWVE